MALCPYQDFSVFQVSLCVARSWGLGRDFFWSRGLVAASHALGKAVTGVVLQEQA